MDSSIEITPAAFYRMFTTNDELVKSRIKENKSESRLTFEDASLGVSGYIDLVAFPTYWINSARS